MSDVLNSDEFGDKIYERFPKKYQEDDYFQNFSLKRYLQSLSEGGFKYTIEEANGLLNLKDPDTTDSKVLPVLFKQFGLDVFNGIPEQFLRYFLPRLSEAWTKKGSFSVIEFIASSLSGVKVTPKITYNEDDIPLVEVVFEMDYTLSDYFPDKEQFMRILENFLPFYCILDVLYYYCFYEEPKIKAEDEELTEVKKIPDYEYGCIVHSSGKRFYPMTNRMDSLLNSTFILNAEFPNVDDDIDPCTDTIIINGEKTVLYN